MSALPRGVLKGITISSFIATVGLCIAFLPLGIKVLKTGPQLKWKAILIWIPLTFVLLVIFYYFGQAG